MKEGELAAELAKFGLTKQEADLFLVLARVRNASPEGVTGHEVSELAGVNRVRTYQLLDRLVDFGIVQVEFGRPKRYAAEDPPTVARRLVSLQESRLDELSHAEAAVADALANALPLVVKSRAEKAAGSRVAVLHGISTIQGVLRRAMQDRDLRIIVNDESEGHIFNTIRYMIRKPKSAKVIFATNDSTRKFFEGNRVEIDGYSYRIKLFRGNLPTIILNGEQCIILFHGSQRYRPKPLSPPSVRTVVSSCVVIEGTKEMGQLDAVYEGLWNLRMKR
jgi:hypothetical protein